MKKQIIILLAICGLTLFFCEKSWAQQLSKPINVPFILEDNKILFFAKMERNLIPFTLDNSMTPTILPLYFANEMQSIKVSQSNWPIYAKEHTIQIYEYAILIDSFMTIPNFYPFEYMGILGTDLFEKMIVGIDFEKQEFTFYHELPNFVKDFKIIELYKNDKALDEYGKRVRKTNVFGFKDKNKNDIMGEMQIDLGAPLTFFCSELQTAVVPEHSDDTLSLGYDLLYKTALQYKDMMIVVVREDGSFDEGAKEKQMEGIQGVIGVDYLKQFHVIFDYKNDKLYLKPY